MNDIRYGMFENYLTICISKKVERVGENSQQ